jgi:hypothetical protein
MFDWGDGTSTDWIRLEETNNKIISSHVWQNEGEYEVSVCFRNSFFEEGVWSDPLKMVIELDTDNDLLSDTTEEFFGTDPSDPSDVLVLSINGVSYYLVITNENIYLLDENQEKTMAHVSQIEGEYLIDNDDDELWDYVYDPVQSSVNVYIPNSLQESPVDIPWVIFSIMGIIGAIILILVILIKTGCIYLYEEYVPEE